MAAAAHATTPERRLSAGQDDSPLKGSTRGDKRAVVGPIVVGGLPQLLPFAAASALACPASRFGSRVTLHRQRNEEAKELVGSLKAWGEKETTTCGHRVRKLLLF
jgi:hypothetical protein